ncbi:MAG: hypothetical protein ACTSUS_09980 [Candidatus Freyarchaeota archaeon]
MHFNSEYTLNPLVAPLFNHEDYHFLPAFLTKDEFAFIPLYLQGVKVKPKAPKKRNFDTLVYASTFSAFVRHHEDAPVACNGILAGMEAEEER